MAIDIRKATGDSRVYTAAPRDCGDKGVDLLRLFTSQGHFPIV